MEGTVIVDPGGGFFSCCAAPPEPVQILLRRTELVAGPVQDRPRKEKGAKRTKADVFLASLPLDLSNLQKVYSLGHKNARFALEWADGSETRLEAESIKQKELWFDALRPFEGSATKPKGAAAPPYPIPDFYRVAIYNCLDFVGRHGTRTLGIFREGKSTPEVISSVLSGGGLDPQTDPRTVGFVAKQLLGRLPETILTNARFDRFMVAATANDIAQLRALVQELPKNNQDVLRKLAQVCTLCNNEDSRMEPKAMAKVVGPNLFINLTPEMIKKMKDDSFFVGLERLFEAFLRHTDDIFASEGADGGTEFDPFSVAHYKFALRENKEEKGVSRPPTPASASHAVYATAPAAGSPASISHLPASSPPSPASAQQPPQPQPQPQPQPIVAPVSVSVAVGGGGHEDDPRGGIETDSLLGSKPQDSAQ